MMESIKKWLATAVAAGSALLALFISLGFLFFALPVLLIVGAIGILRMQQNQQRRPVIIDHVIK